MHQNNHKGLILLNLLKILLDFRVNSYLNLDFNFSKSFMLFSFDKVTTSACNIVSVISNVAPDGGTIGGLRTVFTDISAKTQFFDHAKINSISQLINGISKLFQKLLKYFKGITTSAFVNESLFGGVFPTIPLLYLKDSELVERGSFGSSL